MAAPPTRRGYFLAALSGMLAGALLVSMLPAGAATGDNVVLGQPNQAGRATKIRSKSLSTLQLTNTRGTGGVALELITPVGVPPIRVNRAAWVKNLSADLLDDRHANMISRAAYDVDGDLPDANGDLLSLTITAPKRGMLLMSASIDGFLNQAGQDDYGCVLQVNGTDVLGSYREELVSWPGSPHTLNMEDDCATDGAKTVNAGTYTVTLETSKRNTVMFGDGALWALYVPFDGAGNMP